MAIRRGAARRTPAPASRPTGVEIDEKVSAELHEQSLTRRLGKPPSGEARQLDRALADSTLVRECFIERDPPSLSATHVLVTRPAMTSTAPSISVRTPRTWLH